jgi:hypothetical protein
LIPFTVLRAPALEIMAGKSPAIIDYFPEIPKTIAFFLCMCGWEKLSFLKNQQLGFLSTNFITSIMYENSLSGYTGSDL